MPWSDPARRREYMRAYYAANRDRYKNYRAKRDPEAVREYNRRYVEEHPEQVVAYKRKSNAKHREARREAHRIYAAAHREEDRTRLAAWKKANPERHRAAIRAWRLAHPEETRSYWRKRRVAIRGNGGSHTVEEWLARCQEYDWRCAYCGEKPEKLEQDHDIPISRGGTHDIDNLLPACPPCNRSKGAKTAAEYRGLTAVA